MSSRGLLPDGEERRFSKADAIEISRILSSLPFTIPKRDG